MIFVDGIDDQVGEMDAATWERTLSWHAAVDGARSVPPETVYEISFAAGDPAA